MSQFCSKCGTKNLDEAMFCKNCGFNMQEASEQIKVDKEKTVKEQSLEGAHREREADEIRQEQTRLELEAYRSGSYVHVDQLKNQNNKSKHVNVTNKYESSNNDSAPNILAMLFIIIFPIISIFIAAYFIFT